MLESSFEEVPELKIRLKKEKLFRGKICDRLIRK